MIGELRDQHLGDGRFGGQPAFEQAGPRRRLHHHIRASPAGILRSPHHQHPELGRHDIQALRDVLADAVQCPRAAWTDGARHIDHRLDPRQVCRQSTAVGPSPCRARFALGCGLLLGLRLTRRRFLLGIFQRELKLILRQALDPPPKAMTLELPTIWRSRALSIRSAISITLSRPGSLGRVSACTFTSAVNHR